MFGVAWWYCKKPLGDRWVQSTVGTVKSKNRGGSGSWSASQVFLPPGGGRRAIRFHPGWSSCDPRTVARQLGVACPWKFPSVAGCGRLLAPARHLQTLPGPRGLQTVPFAFNAEA